MPNVHTVHLFLGFFGWFEQAAARSNLARQLFGLSSNLLICLHVKVVLLVIYTCIKKKTTSTFSSPENGYCQVSQVCMFSSALMQHHEYLS